MMNDMIQKYMVMIDGFKLLTMFGMFALDTILGILVAIFKPPTPERKFDWKKLASFIDSDVLKLFGGYLLVGVFALLEPAYALAVPATWAIIEAKLVADIITKLKELGVSFNFGS